MYDFNIVTTEQVSKYHPDKYADQISDNIVTYVLSKNGKAKCAIETLVKDGYVIIAGEISGYELNSDEITTLVKEVASDLNYRVTSITNLIGQQSVEIKNAVEQDLIGAGDQGIMYGFATKESESYLPYGHHIANKIIEAIENDVNFNKILKGDAKTQVTVDVRTNKILTVVISACHYPNITLDELKKHIKKIVSHINLGSAQIIINPAGPWTIGGPTADTGLTGRKIVCDQYGGYMAVGGGAFSGKDLTKVDRSAAYIANKVAKEVLYKHRLEWVKIQVGYAIGLSEPVSVNAVSNIGDVTHLLDPKRFIVSNMISELKGIDLYNLSKGCHFR